MRSGWSAPALSARPRSRRWRTASSPISKRNSPPPAAIDRTRRTGSKAPGPGWKPPPMMTAAATPRRRSNYCARLGIASSRFRMAFTSTARSPDNWKRSAPRSNPVTASIGRPPKRWRSAHCVPREPTSVSPGRIAAAAPSRTGTRYWSTRRPRSATSRSITSARDKRRSSSSTARYRRRRSSVSNTATALPTR